MRVSGVKLEPASDPLPTVAALAWAAVMQL